MEQGKTEKSKVNENDNNTKTLEKRNGTLNRGKQTKNNNEDGELVAHKERLRKGSNNNQKT